MIIRWLGRLLGAAAAFGSRETELPLRQLGQELVDLDRWDQPATAR